MSEWRQASLGEIAEVLDRSRCPVSAAERANRLGDVPYYGASGQTGWIDAALFDEDLVLLGEDAIDFLNPRARKAYAISGRSWVNNHAHVLRARPECVETRFLEHALNHVDYTPYVATGGTRTKLTQAKMTLISLPLPPLAEQRRIVDVMSAVDAQIAALNAESQALRHAYTEATSLLWAMPSGEEAPTRTLGDLMTLDIQRLNLAANDVYRIAGVLNAGQGLVDKGAVKGAETAYKAMNVLRTNQVVMRKLTAWEGPISVVTPAFEGFVASNEFPTFTLAPSVLPSWMSHVCRTSRLWEEMRIRVTGTVQRRKRLNPEQLLSVRLPVPPTEMQAQSSDALDALLKAEEALSFELAGLRSLRWALLSGLLNRSISIPESYDALLEQAS